MKKQTKKTLWRGLTSTSAVLMVVSLFGTQCAITYTGTLNSYLGTTTSRIVSTGDPSAEDTNYYTSEFGDYSAENLQKLIQATYDESVLEQEEGSVLLRNNNSALPLSPNSHVTLFGHAVVQPVYAPGGANSGAASTGTYVIDLYQALKDVGFSINDTLYDAYKNSSTSRVASNNLTISGGPNSTGDFNAAPVLGEEPKSFYTAQLQQSWENDYNDVAIVMLAREGGEDCEMMMEDPDGISALALHQDEKDMLAMIRDSGKFSKIVVLLNSAYPMELGWMDEYNVDACLWIGDPGQRGFEGVANLLTGKANPSGHLTDTYAANSLSSPAAYIGLVAAVAAGAAGLVTDNDLLAIAAPALSAVSLCAFITDSVYTFVGYFFGLAMFGDVSKIGAIMRICVVVAISMLALLISSFMRKDKAM